MKSATAASSPAPSSYVSLRGTDDAGVARVIDATQLAVVGISRTGGPLTVDVPVIALGLDAGATLTDALGGPRPPSPPAATSP